MYAAANPNAQFLLAQLSPSTQLALAAWDGSLPLNVTLAAALIVDLKALLQTWSVKRDLLESGPADLDFVVEVDNHGYGHLPFCPRVSGPHPHAGTLLRSNSR